MKSKLSTPPHYWLDVHLSDIDAIRRFEQKSLAEWDLPNSIYEFIRRSCSYDPQGIAIDFFSDPARCLQTRQSVTYGQLLARINQTGNLLRELGVQREEAVSLLLATNIEAQYAFWGTQAVGIANPVNWMLEPDAIAAIINAAGSKVLFAYGGDEHFPTWQKVQQVVQRCSQLHTVIQAGGMGGELNGAVRVMNFDDVIDQYPADALNLAQPPFGDAAAALFPTGGTTGMPKLARHSQAGIVTSAWLSAVVAGIQAGEARLSATPMFHVVGAYAGCLATLARGGRLVLPTSLGWRHPALLDNIWSVVRELSVAYLTIVPTIMNQLVRKPLNQSDLATLKGVMSGSAPLSEHIATTFESMTGLGVREGYGMTETTSVMMMNPRGGTIKTGSVGLPFPYHRVRLIRREPNGIIKECGQHESGLLAISGPTVFSGYAQAALDNDAWVEPGQWLDTGDIARVDEDGYVWLVGRTKDVIIRGGHNIDPKAVEEIFYRHPDVVEAAVVGRPDAHAGEVPVAFVQLRPGSDISADALLEFVSAHTSERAAIPKSCYLIPVMPKSPMGKILRNPLRAQALEHGIRLMLDQAGFVGDYDIAASDTPQGGLAARVSLPSSQYDESRIRGILGGLPAQLEVRRI